MIDKKVFFIGLNKTATTSLFHLFKSNGYECLDNPEWWYFENKSDFDKYDIFTDGYERFERSKHRKYDRFLNLEFLFSNFPDEYFILQHRPITDWLVSRLNMYSKGNLVLNPLDAKKQVREDLGMILYWQEKVKYLAQLHKVKFMTLDVSLPDETIIYNLETFFEREFNIKVLERINVSSEFLSEHTIKYNKNIVKEFFKSYFFNTVETVH